MLQKLFSFFFPDRVVIDKRDAYDRAYLWAWTEGNMRDLIRLCYKTPDFADNARRFYESDEFKAELALLASLGQVASPHRRALDFGCGNGVASYALARAGYSVVGLDSSRGRLAGLNAAKRLRGLDAVRIDFRSHRGETLDFAPETFDVIYIREVLHHIHDLAGFLRQVRQILRPGGVVCCIRDVVIWSEEQRADFFAKHPLNFITQDENCYYLHEYLLAFVAADLDLKMVLAPTDSIINTYPTPHQAGPPYDYAAARSRVGGYDIFSFFARKPAD